MTITVLRPVGVVRIDGERIDAMAESDPIRAMRPPDGTKSSTTNKTMAIPIKTNAQIIGDALPVATALPGAVCARKSIMIQFLPLQLSFHCA